MQKITDLAYNLAVNELRICYDPQGIVAGRHHYDDYWTRDAAFGCFGALLLNDTEIVKKQLQLLKGYQKDGMIPFLIRKHLPPFSMLGLKLKIDLYPQYRSHKALFMTKVIDSNTYFVIVACELIKKNKGKHIEEYSDYIESALEWCQGRLDDDLAREGPIAGWNDGIYKTGKVFITNLLFWKAFDEWENICKEYNHKMDPRFKRMAGKIKGKLNSLFFNGSYYIDWIDTERHEFFDANANLLAIYFGLPNLKQSEQITTFVKTHLLDTPFIKLSYPAYPKKYQEIFNRLFGMGDYTDGLYWPEPLLLYVISLSRIGKKREAARLLEKYAQIVVRNKGIHEVYTPNKTPVARLQYRSEYPYARGSALYIIAHNCIKNRS